MIYDTTNSKGLMLVDHRGIPIPGAYQFNDETCEVKFFLVGRQLDANQRNRVITSLLSKEGENYEAEVIRASAVIKGAKMVQRYANPTPETDAAEDRVAAAIDKVVG